MKTTTKKILNYHIHIEKELLNKKVAYNAHCPALGLADYGATIDKSLKNITALIEFHLETLAKQSRPIPLEKNTTTIMTSVQVRLPQTAFFSHA